jgi:hypothetical protein
LTVHAIRGIREGMNYAVYVEQDEEVGYGKPPVKDFVKKGVRKTLRAATSLAEKYVGTIYGYIQKGEEMHVETSRGKAIIKRGYYNP